MIWRVAARGIIFKEGKLLCAQLNPYRKPREEDFWSTPGGGVDEGEGLVTALEREMLEETGIPAKVGKLLYIQQYMDGENEHLEFLFNIENVEDYEHIDLSKSTHGVEEIKTIEFISPAEFHILPEFLKSQNISGDIAGSSPPKIFNYL